MAHKHHEHRLSIIDTDRASSGQRAQPSYRPGRPWTRGEPVRLSMLMPALDEERTMASAIEAVLAVDFPCETELIVVDDGSRDRTWEVVNSVSDARVVGHRHPRNLGKGAALHTAAAIATGTHIVPFDADLEYSPADLLPMIAPVLDGRCDVVYGTRLFGQNTVYQSYRQAMGNRWLTLAANLLYDSYLSDIHTCLKLMPLRLFHVLDLRENGFGLDTEITAKLLRIGVRPFEVPVSYHSRSYEMGKKITWRHGLECLHVLARVRLEKAAALHQRSAEARVDAASGRFVHPPRRARQPDHASTATG